MWQPVNQPSDTEAHAEETRRSEPTRRVSRVPVLIGTAANAATLVWSGLAILLSGRGLGHATEGFYLLSYEYWDSNPRTSMGFQYLFGPVFDALGHDVAGIRLVRLALILAAHAFFGVSFARWLRLRRPQAPAGPAWEYAVGSVVVASGAILYGWLPPTPGYNDVAMLGCLALVGLLLVTLRAVDLGRPVPWWGGVVWGMLAGAIVLAKLPGIASVLLIGVASAYAVRKAGGRLLIVLGATAFGFGLFAAGIQVFVMSWTEIVPPVVDQLHVVSASNHSVSDTIVWYVESSLVLLRAALVVCAPTALAAGVAYALRRRVSPGRRTPIVLVGLAASVALLAGAGGLRAGADNVLAFTSGIVAMTLLVAGATARGDRPWREQGAGTVTVVVLLALIPALQAVGTNNALYAVAVNGAAFWVALMLFLLTRATPELTPGFALGAASTALAVLLAVVIGVDGLTHDGSGRSLVTGPVAPVTGSAELSSIELPAGEATAFSRLREDLGIRPGTHRPMLALGELSQYVLVLGGHPIGNAWYSRDDDGLNGADLRAACRHGNPWGADQPLVVASRNPSADELAAWRTCGIDFGRDYADVTPPSAPDGIKILRWHGSIAASDAPSVADSSASD